jgi:hypothetical protein
MVNMSKFIESQKLLIEPFNRLQFITGFVMVTILSEAIIYFISSYLFPVRRNTISMIEELRLGALVFPSINQIIYSVSLGFLTGLGQGLILRRHIPVRRWLSAVFRGTSLIALVQAVFLVLGSLVINSSLNKEPPIFDVLIASTILLGGLIMAVLMYGYLQWWAIHPYIKKSRWWILLPAAVVLTAILLILTFNKIPFWLQWLKPDRDAINIALLPIVQSVSFCFLKKKQDSTHPVLNSSLALANEIVDYRSIQRLKRILYRSISDEWKADLEEVAGKLTYLVGINNSGNIIACEPMNQASIDHVWETSLPNLYSDPSILEAEDSVKFAKFQVIFTPPGIIQIRSWQGISPLLIGVFMFIIVMTLLTFLLTKLGLDGIDFNVR